MTKKAANYSASDIEQLMDGYDPTATQDERNVQVKQLAADMGRKPASIIAKLVNLEVYVKKVHVAKDGSTSLSKDERVTLIASKLGVMDEVIQSLTKANVSVIKLIDEVIGQRDMANHNLAAVLDSMEQTFVQSSE